MADQTLHDAFIDEIRDAYDAEKQLIKALPKMAKAANSAELKEAFETHLELCPWCAGYLEQIRETITTLGAVSSDNLPAETQNGLLEAFRAFRRPAAGQADHI